MERPELENYLSLVAFYLGGWKVDKRCKYNIYLKGDGLNILVRSDTWKKSEKGKLFLSGILPKKYTGNSKLKTISVSYSRTPLSVSKDLKKRLIEQLIIENNEEQQRYRRSEEQEESLNNFTNLIKNVGLEQIRIDRKDKYYNRELSGKNKNMIMNIKLSEKYKNEIKIYDLTKDQMIKLAYFLKDI